MIEISRDLAENLIDDVSDLLSSIRDMRQYERYNRRCVAYEAEIDELKAALKKKESPSTAYNKPSAKCPRCHGVNMVAGKFDTGWEAVPCPKCQVLDTSHVG